MLRTLPALAAAATLLLSTGCAGPATDPAGASPASTAHHHHDPATDPALEPAGGTGTPALGRPMTSMADLSAWVRSVTGECARLSPAGQDELADYLGPARVGWYRPFVAEWATCGVEPYDRLGLVLFGPGQQRALQRFWARGLATGELTENPDWAFGNGFAITAGPLGAELGLRYLWCAPVDDPDAHTVPADVEGCVYATTHHHS
jgi:hypothetical protein